MVRVLWRGFELPARVTCDQESCAETYARFVAEPFERGFGATVGNSLRRVLLSSIEGAAVTGIRIDGVAHEFSTIEGVVEDVTDIVLNVKGLLVKLHADGPKSMKIEAKKKGEVTAKNIQADPDIEIINQAHHIATLSTSVPFIMEMEVNKGRGYQPAGEYLSADQPIGFVPVDALFSPVQRVAFHTEDTRVGRRTNYDRLILEVWTDGTITPEMALVEAAKILRKHLNPFIDYYTLGGELTGEGPLETTAGADLGLSDEVQEKLARPISELELSIRAYNCLSNANINTVGDLVTRTDNGLLEIRNFGNTSLKEVKKKLEDMGLHLGMGQDEQTQGGE